MQLINIEPGNRDASFCGKKPTDLHISEFYGSRSTSLIMKSLTVFALVLATATLIQAEDNLMENYLKYLMPYVEPCAQEQQLSNAEATNIQMIPKEGDKEKLACLRSCVMKKMGSLVDNKVQLDVVNTMIETVHAGTPDDIPRVKQIASDCVADAESQSSECQIGMKYADCYIGKLMGVP